MGKDTYKKCLSGHPGCAWDLILHTVKYPDWHYVKKRLPHRKHGGNKQATGDENPINKKISNVDKLQEACNDQMNNPHGQELRQGTTTSKSSVKAQIKSLVNEEFSKRKKDKHHRTSTYPVRSRLTRTNSIHHLKASNGDFPFEITSTDESPENANKSNQDSNRTISMDSLLEMSFEEPIANRETGEDFQVDENGRQLIANHMLLQENLEDERRASLEHNLINSNNVTAHASLYPSKEYLDALDMINMNKEFFLKILHDPSSPFAHHFHNQQTLDTRMGLSESESFSLPDLSGRRVPRPSKLKHKQDVNRSCEKEEDICKQSMPSKVVEYRDDGIRKVNQAVVDIADRSSSGSARHFNNPGKNEVVIKRFKDLKQKIKHAIKESKNERHRITMDAILHKIPHNQGFSKDFNNEILDQLKDPSILSDSKDSPSSSLKSDHTALIRKRRQCIRRTSSLNETLERYCQLYESTFNREAKQPNSERLKLKREVEASSSRNTAKSLERIFSLPDIESYYYKNEDLSDACSSLIPVSSSVNKTGSINGVGEQNSTDMPMASEYCSQLNSPVESQNQENLVETSETDSCTGDQVGLTSVADSMIVVDKLSDDLITLTTRDSASDDEWDIEAKATEASPVTVFDFNSQEVGESTAEFSCSEESEEMLEFLIPGEVNDSLTGHQYESSMYAPLVAHNGNFEKVHVQVDAKDKAKFDYVKYILELTGFSGNESLGTWHSEDQPVDPSVYEEVGGCILLDPDCSRNEGRNCNHKLLFDLINEVLMEIYERSYSYYPKPLSSRCHIPQMPAGNRVLKEVWRNISGYLSLRPELDQSLDYIASRDLLNNEGWMKLQFNSECVALEVEDLIFNQLLGEVIFS